VSELLRAVLTAESYALIDDRIDALGVFAKPYWLTVDGVWTEVGMRIGLNPGRTVAFFGDTVEEIGDGLFAVHRSAGVTAELWNRVVSVGSRVVAHPGARGGDASFGTVTRSPAWNLGHGLPVVKVEGHAAGIALTHVDVIGGAA
jgi:hypothetical protein